MTEGVDYSFPPLPSPTGLAAAGKHFAGRYVGPGSGKFLTAGERDALFAVGIDIFLLAEGAAADAAGGYSVGVQHATLARDHANSLGAPESAAIYFAVDYDVASSAWSAPRDYLAGAASVIGLSRVGVYGKRDVMAWAARDGVAHWFFQTYAWSNGQWYAGNHVEQYLNGQSVAGGTVDLCRAMQNNFGQWAAKKEDDMGWQFQHYGDQGDAIRLTQQQLRAAGAAIDVTGVYDDATAKAIVDLGLTGGDSTGHTLGDTEQIRLIVLMIQKNAPAGPGGAVPPGTRFTAVVE